MRRQQIRLRIITAPLLATAIACGSTPIGEVPTDPCALNPASRACLDRLIVDAGPTPDPGPIRDASTDIRDASPGPIDAGVGPFDAGQPPPPPPPPPPDAGDENDGGVCERKLDDPCQTWTDCVGNVCSTRDNCGTGLTCSYLSSQGWFCEKQCLDDSDCGTGNVCFGDHWCWRVCNPQLTIEQCGPSCGGGATMFECRTGQRVRGYCQIRSR